MQTALLSRTRRRSDEHQTLTCDQDPNTRTWRCGDANLACLIPTDARFHFRTSLSLFLPSSQISYLFLLAVSFCFECSASGEREGKEEKNRGKGGKSLGSATQMLFASSISELQAECVCVCVLLLFLNRCTERAWLLDSLPISPTDCFKSAHEETF